MDLSWTMYKSLYEHRVPESLDNIVVLDGDVKKLWRKLPTEKNFVLLPSELAPERMLYEFLYRLDPMDTLWSREIGGYSKDVCFRDYPNYIEMGDGSIDAVKACFESQKIYAGRGYSRFINRWKVENQSAIDDFIQSFINAHNYVANRIGSGKIVEKSSL